EINHMICNDDRFCICHRTADVLLPFCNSNHFFHNGRRCNNTAINNCNDTLCLYYIRISYMDKHCFASPKLYISTITLLTRNSSAYLSVLWLMPSKLVVDTKD